MKYFCNNLSAYLKRFRHKIRIKIQTLTCCISLYLFSNSSNVCTRFFLPMIDLEWVIHKFCIMDNVYLVRQSLNTFQIFIFLCLRILFQFNVIIYKSKNLSGVREKLNILCRFNERPKL